MAAIFYNYTDDDIFSTKIASANLISVSGISELENNDSMLLLLTGVGISTAEIVQYFVSFDDLIRYFHFGSSVGSITINGTMFMGCNGDLPGLTGLCGIISRNRGKTVTVSLGGYWFTGVLTNPSISVSSDFDTVADFSLSMNLISHNLQSSTPPKGGCAGTDNNDFNTDTGFGSSGTQGSTGTEGSTTRPNFPGSGSSNSNWTP